MGNELAKALKRKTDAQFRVTSEDQAPGVVETPSGQVVVNDPSAYMVPYVAGKNVSIGTAGSNKVINADMNIRAGDNMTVSEPDENGAVEIGALLPDPYSLPQSSESELGGVKAIPKSNETLPIAIDSSTGLLYTKDKVQGGSILPTPSIELRGTIWTVFGDPLISDETYVCQKDATDTYIWKII